MKSIRAQVIDAEQNARLGPEGDEQFPGYGVMGLSFSSGHVLAMRRFPVTSLGPGYASVLLRRPSGSWTIYADAAPDVSCVRYVGAALNIGAASTADTAFTVTIGGDVDLTWDVELESTSLTTAMSTRKALQRASVASCHQASAPGQGHGSNHQPHGCSLPPGVNLLGNPGRQRVEDELECSETRMH
ncbi:hypothetical protein QFZ35_003981 [Arthrobacter ulcerisalmonis]|nr:hypothetical protein [Arthrobacter ulcerisalmonis]